MEKIFHATIYWNTGRICGTGEYDLGYFRFPVNAWAKIVEKVESSSRIDGFVDNYKKAGKTIEKEFYSFTVGDLIVELATGEVTYACINGTDYYFSVEPIKLED